MTLITLFVVSFLSATLIPLGSEALLLHDVLAYYALFPLWIVATLGNTLGSMTNYYLGLKGERYLEEKGHISVVKIQKYKDFFDRYGVAVLLLSWLPIIGDPLTLVAGLLRYNFKYFNFIVFIAKGVRYLVVIFFASSLLV